MNRQPPRRRPPMLVLPAGQLLRILGALALTIVIATVVLSGALGRAATGATVADRNTVAVQQAAAERDLDAGFVAATDQVKKARALHLAISAQQADAIANKALTDLATLRHSALLSIGQALGLSADAAENYAKTTEQAMDSRRGQPQPSAAPVLLAPRFFAIVSRFNDLATQISDQAAADLTQSPPAAPSPSTTPRPTPPPSPTR